MELNESQIIAECVSGNWSRFGQIYDLYLPKIYQYLYYRLRHRQTAEDITSAVFTKAVENLASFRNSGAPFSAWLYRIARNTMLTHLKSARPTDDLEQAFDLASDDDVAGETDRTLKLETIRDALSGLNEQQREVLTMRVWDGLSHAEIAGIMKISEGNSKVIFSRALSALKLKVPLAVMIAMLARLTI